MSRHRHLSPEERELWNKIAKSADPLKKPAEAHFPISDGTRPDPDKKPNPRPIPSFQMGSAVDHRADHDLLPALAEQLSSEPVRMDSKAFGKLRRGKLAPEGRIDLHGMTLGQAQPALLGFIRASHAGGRRLVLVITGKGRHMQDDDPVPSRLGVLRHQVPLWLRSPPLASLVLQVTPAHQRHGGHGAYYVYLRRSR